jgi:predicted Zn-dependent protease
MNRRNFLFISSLLSLNAYAGSFSLDQIRGVSNASNGKKIKSNVYWFIKQRLPKIIVKDNLLQDYILKIATPIFKTSSLTLDWKIFIVSENQINAYTLGGGLVLVDIDLIKMCKTETELASVIAHEVGHIHNKHAERRFLTNRIYNQFKVKRFKNTDIDLLYKSYKRTAEHEADAFIIKAFLKTNYSINHASDFFVKLKNIYPSNKNINHCLHSTHPLTEERIEKLNKIASTFTQVNYKKVNSKEFQYLKQRIKS